MKKIVVGLLIVAAGVLLFCINTGLLPYELRQIIFSWQMLLIAIGFSMLFDRKHNTITSGIIIMLIGAAFLLSKIFPSFIHSGMYWPLILIAGGIVYIAFALRKNRDPKEGMNSYTKTDNAEVWMHNRRKENNFITQDYVFSGSKETIANIDFKGAEINAVFSGVELDFTQCEIAEESKAIQIQVSSIFSGVIIYVPLDWNIQVRKTGVFGDFVDKRPKTSLEIDDKKVVILDVTAVFGGGEIKYHE